MPLLITAVVIIGALSTLNLILTAAVIRRLRAQENASSMDGGPDLGAPVPGIAGTSTNGDVVDLADLAGRPGIMAFFSVDCESCLDHGPRFAEAARVGAESGSWAVAVVMNGGADPTALLSTLPSPVTVIREDRGGAFLSAFGVRGFPLLLAVDTDGRVDAKGDIVLNRIELTPKAHTHSHA